MRKPVAYIAGPYRGPGPYDILQNIRKAEHYALKYWSLGYAVICPHKNTAMMDGALPDHVWLEGSMELLRRADVVVMLPGWESSDGSCAERKEAYRLDKQVVYED
jgi:hypothetical protein